MTNPEWLKTLSEKMARLPTLFSAEEVDLTRRIGLYVQSLERQASDYGLEETFRRGDPGHPDNEMGM
jgi:hypothetical protein